jgi:hypothetical protein
MERDDGVRCDRHVGEVHPPRCVDCDRERLRANHEALQAAIATAPGRQEASRVLNAMLTAAITGTARPSELFVEAIPESPADAWSFASQVVDGLVGMLAGELSRRPDPLALLHAMAREIEGVGPTSL